MNAIAQASSVSGPQLDNRRVLAGVVDLMIVALGAAVVLFAGDALSGDRSDVQGALGAVILGWALYYYFALESGDGQTVGKKLMKLRVMRADGRPAGMREIAVRTVLRVVDMSDRLRRAHRHRASAASASATSPPGRSWSTPPGRPPCPPPR